MWPNTFYFHSFLSFFLFSQHSYRRLFANASALSHFCGSIGWCLQGMQKGESYCWEHTGGSDANLISHHDTAALSFKCHRMNRHCLKRPPKKNLLSEVWCTYRPLGKVSLCNVMHQEFKQRSFWVLCSNEGRIRECISDIKFKKRQS